MGGQGVRYVQITTGIAEEANILMHGTVPYACGRKKTRNGGR